MTLQQLQTFCQVVETGTFGRAARLLNLSQPAVTRHLQGLEDSLGARLLERGGAGVQLTAVGEVVYEYAQRIARDVRSLRCQLRDNVCGGALRLGVTAALSSSEVTWAVSALLHATGDRRVVIRTMSLDEVIARVLAGALDVGLVAAPVRHETLQTIPLAADDVIFVASPLHPLAARTAGGLTGLDGQSAAVLSRGFFCRDSLEQLCQAFRFRPRIVLEVDSADILAAALRSAPLLSFVSRSTVAEDLAQGLLVPLEIPDLPSVRQTVSLVMQPDAPLASLCDALSNLRAPCAPQPAAGA